MQPKPLVQFDAAYYQYPTSVSRGFWARYPLEEGLLADDRQRRKEWLEEIERLSRSNFHKMIVSTFADPSDHDVLQATLLEHGIFAERFFHRSLRERVTRKFSHSPSTLAEFERLNALAFGYELHLHNTSDAISRILDYCFEQNLYNALNDPAIHRQLEIWFENSSRPATCVLCGNSFRTIDLPDWIYFGSNGFIQCCFQCRIVDSPNKSSLASLIPSFVEACGFIPTSNVGPINYAFTSRLVASQWAKAMLAYAQMGGVEHVRKKFGSWFVALAKTGALPDGVLTTARGIRCLAKDGHICHSLDEQRIDNWLYSRGLIHEREPIYPRHASLNPSGKRRANWKVREAFIEYFGLVGDTEYDRTMEEKILLAQQSNISMIALYPADIEKLDQKLELLLH